MIARRSRRTNVCYAAGATPPARQCLTRSERSTKLAVLLPRLLESWVLVPGGSIDGCVASTCRSPSPWRRKLARRPISELSWHAVGPRGRPKSGICSRISVIEATPARIVTWRASSLRGARTLRQDIEAVRNAVMEPWSNGQTEGQINRLKTLKRAMYGRAGVDLLRARMMPLQG